MSISQILSNTRDQLSGKWITAILTLIVYGLVAAVAGSVVLGVLILGHLAVGLASWSLHVARREELRIEQLFDGFQSFVSPLAAYLLMGFAISLGFLFFIIPGIILALGFSQVVYILADDPKRDGLQALQDSWKMMRGNKTKLVFLYFRFFLLSLLCILTLGIGFFFLTPYIAVARANFYLAISNSTRDSFDAEYIVT